MLELPSHQTPQDVPADEWTLTQEQTNSLYHSLPVSLLSSIVIALILSLSHWKIIGQAEIILWNLLLGSTLLARLTLWIFWQNAWQLYSANFWLWSFRIGVWLTGAAWGTTAILLFAHDNAIYQALLAFSLAGVAAGSMTSLTADKYSSLGFVILAITPLSLFIFLEDGPTAVAMSSMTLLFIFFVIASSIRTRRNMEEQIQKNQHLLQLTAELNHKQQLEKIINNAQSTFITDNNIKLTLQNLLNETLIACNSELGFIGQIEKNSDNTPFMRALVFGSTQKEKAAIDKFRATHLPENGEYRNLDNLFGLVMQSEKPVISANISRDMRAGTMPDGHPKIHNFMGIPIFNGRDQIAILGLANCTQGYQQEDTIKLEPILKTIAQFVQTMNHEQRHAQDRAALEASTQHTQTILNDIADGIITIDKRGVIQSFNHAAETIFGYRARQIIGKNISELMPEPFRSQHDDYIRNHLKTGKKNILGIGREVIGLRRNGQQFPMDLMVSRVFQNGEPIFIGIVRDITDKKQADNLRNQFISSASKEILGPLNLISEALQRLKNKEKDKLPENLFHVVEIAHTNSLRLQQLMHDLIEVQSLSKGDSDLKMESQSALPLVDEALRRNKAFGDIYQNNAKLIATNEEFTIQVDSARFYQALSLLLQCAFKSSTPGSEIVIQVLEDRSRINVGIYFNTRNLLETQRKQLAAQFNSTQDAANTPLHSSELGLAIAKEIIEKMHGIITFNSKADQHYFLVEFPRAVKKI
ncbi:PAS domain S-box protein [Cellvibrio sp. KY-GH-1]|uniref:PAS domain S-box protein n=1 Tax=Cellvibrio sp. KY-GH-1 TaxID=2303332 RepID=UPI0012481FCB|nr:PAS domain S-box protein [Cellvibrio sp. KY-GH-1]QEY18677.1 PAS domain S-box protein [Cellvibrio sp. KY-GH-1]